jgi:Xaa-Pro dipeptidase
MTTATGSRLEKLAENLRRDGLDCFFAHDPISMGYLTGYREGAGERFMTLAIHKSGEVRLICPALSEAQARREGISNIRAWKDGENHLVHFEELARDWDLDSGMLAVDATMPARMLLEMQGALPAALFRNGEQLLSELMRRKDPFELDLLLQAAKIADDTWIEVLPQLRAGMTEAEVATLLLDGMTRRGGKPYFAIVAAGKGGAEPHHLSDDTPLRDGDVVVIDFGCEVSGYKSDITRTIAIGSASDRAREVYEIVFRAHMAAREAIRPGVPGEQIDQAARKVIEDAGYGEYFYHRLGHGIGMNGHEAPNMVAGNTEPLEPGNCFSVEPGIYIEGEFGVRIENIVYCTEDGYKSFNDDPSPTLLIAEN